jgi:cleavage and polyadenylation specificity factor subunit 1
MHALYQEILPPSGVEFATVLCLTPASLAQTTPSDSSSFASSSGIAASGSKALCNVVVARLNVLRIYEVREELAPIGGGGSGYGDGTKGDDHGGEKEGTEAVEGEVEMDEGGEGFINIAKVYLSFLRPFNCIRLHSSTILCCFFTPYILNER